MLVTAAVVHAKVEVPILAVSAILVALPLQIDAVSPLVMVGLGLTVSTPPEVEVILPHDPVTKTV